MVFCNRAGEDYKWTTECHNPYFNRWFSAINYSCQVLETGTSHNPYFNRWFSAIFFKVFNEEQLLESQSLF